MSLGRPVWKEARATIQHLLSDDVATLRDNAELRQKAFVEQSDVQVKVNISFLNSPHFLFRCLCLLISEITLIFIRQESTRQTSVLCFEVLTMRSNRTGKVVFLVNFLFKVV